MGFNLCNECEVIGLHNHTEYSNKRLRDATNKIEDLILTAYELNYKGIALTEHESVSSHVKALQALQKLKTPNEKKNQPAKITGDFKLILGNEIYLVDSLEEVRDNYQGGGVTKFPHFLLLAKDEVGHEQLRYMSSQAWKQSFQTGLMLRTPTVKAFLKEVVDSNPGHLIASSACLGSEICIRLLEMRDALENNDKDKAKLAYVKGCEFINWCVEVFGKEDFYLELQPAYSEEQIFCNKHLLKLAEKFGLKYIITTDSHYLRPEDRVVHKAFLNSKEGEREVDAFYEATFVQSIPEIQERLNYLSHDVIKEALKNTIEIGNKIEEYTILKPTVVPKIKIPEFQIRGLFKRVYDRYEYINKMAHSDDEQNRYMIKLLEDGVVKYLPYKTYTSEKMHQVMARINVELEELWKISETVNQAATAYYITVQKIVDIMWADDCGDSLVGPSRGSALGFLICYLLGITQINPLEQGIELPHWRHLTAERPEWPDIDLDSQKAKREQIFSSLKNYFGEDRVLQVATFGTEAPKSAVQTAARGLGIDNDIAMYVSGMIPFERGSSWSLSDCIKGNEEEDREPVQEFIREINKHPDWLKVAMKIEGMINKRSIHASGVIIFNEEYYKTNALMTAPNGTHITQFSLDDCEALSNMKFDLLTIEALDKMRVTIDHLLANNEVEWQGTLRATYDKYLHPDVIDQESPEVYQLIGEDKVIDLFQFSTQIGIETAKKVKPTTLIELAAANSLMRLLSDSGDSPIDTFVKHKNNINLWYQEMRGHQLSAEEIKIMENHLLKFNGVADTQELVMLMSMANDIAGFGVKDANKLRKAIAKPKKMKEELTTIKEKFFKQGHELGTSSHLLSYVWDVQVSRQLSYSFSILHTLAYSVVALQEVNLNLKYDPIYWQTACLTVNSGSMSDGEDGADIDTNDASASVLDEKLEELDGSEIDGFTMNKQKQITSIDINGETIDLTEDKNTKKPKAQSTDYGKIASAIGNMQSRGVKIALPSINKASFGFTPDVKNQQIIFGLKGINGIGDDAVQLIIKNRPYNSLEDFIERMYDSSLIKKGQMIQLIKAGCFEEFSDRISTMEIFIDHIYEKKERVTMQNFSMLMKNKLIPDQFKFIIKLFNFRNYVMKRVYKKDGNNKFYQLDKVSLPFYNEHFSSEGIIGVNNDFPIISDKVFKKEYDQKTEEIKEWMKNSDILTLLNDKLYRNEWENLASGSVSSWEMDALSFYYTEHELVHVNKDRYELVNFNELPEQPEVVEMMKFKGVERPKFKLGFIVGTVLDKNKTRHTVTLLTPDGVVTVKYYDGAFSHYNKQISKPKEDGTKQIVEKSWFSRGNKLVIQGYRRGSQFKPHKYFNSPTKHTTLLITDVDQEGNLQWIEQRKEI